MTKRLPYRRNSAGFWIDSKTGRFAKKSDYLPYLEREQKSKAAKSEASKAYWKDVKQIQQLFNLNTQDARRKLYNTPKYIQKRGKTPKRFKDFWREAKAGNMNKKDRADYLKRLEEDDFELTTY